ncbi:ANTAR domain-containing protein [Actinokineospora inagensis]|uniref:ANTAR domain-containing protein n=1 Tax=Actinokineospora inagensis TaxID=103730 RepID=UPI0005525CBB|nr:ANTAR domain-containing protein [Actinokineospora inagensis]
MTDVVSLAQELAEVTRLIGGEDVASALDRFTDRAVRTVPGCTRAAITVRAHDGEVETIGAPDVDFRVPGPVREALAYHEPRRMDDAAADQRWPAFATQMLMSGYRGCLVLPVPTHRPGQAVFSMFSGDANQFDSLSFDFVMLLTLNAGVVFDNVSLYQDSTRLVEQLRTALETRTTIGQAQGLLMQRFDYDAETAFQTLTVASQNTNRKLRDVSAALVEAHSAGNLEFVLRVLTARESV